jgi:PadR family transcriptional regulator PadR
MAYKNSLITGITDLLVLAILNNSDSYVYEIAKIISNDSGGLLSISHNTVYTATYKLEEQQMISEYSKLVGKKRTRIYYHIEQKGNEYLKELQENYSNMTTGVEKILSILGGNNADE